MARLSKNVAQAIKCGITPKIRNWRKIQIANLTRAEKVMRFIEDYLIVPEGAMVGKPIKLIPFQEAFIYAIYDNPNGTRKAYLSIARKNGKSALIAGIMLAHVIGPEANKNSQLISGARSREQSALVFHQAEKMIQQNKELDGLYRIVPSAKSIMGVSRNTLYKAISADASTAHGLSPAVGILDEIGQIVGPNDGFVSAITTSQGAHEEPLLIAISTSAPTDADMFSVWVDDAERSGDKHTVCHVYKADEGSDLLDKRQWLKANPALGAFRSRKDLEEQLKQASRLPSMEASARNLLLNMRISQESLWLAPAVWKANTGKPNWDVFREKGVHIGLDLSTVSDLTCAVMSAKDEDGKIHVHPFTFSPLGGIRERSLRDKVPYSDWARDGVIWAPPGATLNYDLIAEYIKSQLDVAGIEILSIQFDRWRITSFQSSCEHVGFAMGVPFEPVGQGFRDISPRMEAFETALLEEKLLTGNHPVLNLGASSAISIHDAAGNSKVDKSKSSQKIDGIVAAIMSVYPWLAESNPDFDPAALIG